MGVTTHMELCEYLLLDKHPDGLKKNEFVPELLRRGWRDRYDTPAREITNDDEKGHAYIKSGQDIYEKFYRNLRVKNGKIVGESSWVAHNVIDWFCGRHEMTTEELLKARRKGNKKMIEHWEPKENYGAIFYNLDGDEKFKFYPGSSNTPMAWHHHIQFDWVAKHILDREIYFAKDSDSKATVDLYLDIAQWYCNKFNKNFYDILMQVNKYDRSNGLNVSLRVDPRLKNIEPRKPA